MANYLNYTIEDREGVKLVNLSGNISTLTKDDFTDVVNKLTVKNNVIINLRDVDLITSSGMNALVEISTEARKSSKRVLVMGMKESMVRLIDSLDLYEFFIFVESIEEGLMKLRYFT
jgi:anti-anti-sigma factor